MKKNLVLSILFIAVTAIFAFSVVIINKAKEPEKAKAPKAVVAFIIDDWGYNDRNIDIVRGIDKPLTISILPRLRYSKYIAETVLRECKQHNIILHLPLESKTDIASEIYTIRGNMDGEEIALVLEENIKSVPGIIGVSGHQGSKATEDPILMGLVLSELKKRDLFFIDSMTTPDSICEDVSAKIGLRYAKRDVFLDLTDETDTEHFEDYIKSQLEELALAALENDRAIGIGHNKSVTLSVIRDFIPELEEAGIKIVPLERLVR